MTTQIDARQFRKALGSFTTGVTVVTTQGADGRDYGLTANSFNSVSMDPPMVLWSLGKKSSSLPVFAATDYFAVHILAADQEAVSNRFSKSGADKFAGCELTRGHGGVPLLDGCSARFECRVVHRYEGGDHVIFVGEVMNFDSFDHAPLVFHGGNYGLVMKKGEAAGQTASSFRDGWLGFLLARAYYQLLVPVRNNLNGHGLQDIDYNILTVLSMGDGRTIEELDKLVSISGLRVTPEDVETLAARGIVAMEANAQAEKRVVRFTESGRSYAIELLSIAKAAESDAERELDYREAQMLKLLLKRVIESTTAALPDHWRRDQFWRDEHLWRDPVASDAA
ncbi:flavin reductase domain-containing protein [Caballeronia arationis]|jgi:3-hydroxy-9,10-secoandrosta-1,3,5(10)-triene-9,17-dione monooxygenase reductase component|uniref:flavin reductase family protein n=1 Tax=Caballeronia arationis TaxID=1777142 RepID=UPI00074C2959|nr:flavin reductase family protein [Caballeronia arationis]SAK51074.1 flavin reductase domain-containing protein [Caballeronia arationis]